MWWDLVLYVNASIGEVLKKSFVFFVIIRVSPRQAYLLLSLFLTWYRGLESLSHMYIATQLLRGQSLLCFREGKHHNSASPSMEFLWCYFCWPRPVQRIKPKTWCMTGRSCALSTQWRVTSQNSVISVCAENHWILILW